VTPPEQEKEYLEADSMKETRKLPSLTKTLASEIVKKALGTAKGLKLDEDFQLAPSKQYTMILGEFCVRVAYCTYTQSSIAVIVRGGISSTVSLYDPYTLMQDFRAESERERIFERMKREEEA